jgi:serine/threonine protein phosphatase PrpC
MRISASGITDKGRRRPVNEDDLAIVDLTTPHTIEQAELSGFEVGSAGVLLAVCDGVGGRRAGEVASALALSSLIAEMEEIADGCPRRTLFGAAVERVNQAVWKKAHEDPRLEGMATTLTAAVLCRGRAVLAHVGDSRAYVLRQGAIRQVTRDQSFVQSLVASGTLTAAEAENSPFRNVILQALGREKSVEVALDALDLEAGDTLILCTDGLSEKVKGEEIASALAGKDLREALRGLVDLANQRGGEDNITVLAARIDAG